MLVLMADYPIEGSTVGIVYSSRFTQLLKLLSKAFQRLSQLHD